VRNEREFTEGINPRGYDKDSSKRTKRREKFKSTQGDASDKFGASGGWRTRAGKGSGKRKGSLPDFLRRKLGGSMDAQKEGVKITGG